MQFLIFCNFEIFWKIRHNVTCSTILAWMTHGAGQTLYPTAIIIRCLTVLKRTTTKIRSKDDKIIKESNKLLEFFSFYWIKTLPLSTDKDSKVLSHRNKSISSKMHSAANYSTLLCLFFNPSFSWNLEV